MSKLKLSRPKGYEDYDFPFTVTKPWGKEEWLELFDLGDGRGYCYKRISINRGHKTSFQYHERKIETNYVIEGKAEVWLEDDQGGIEKKVMCVGDSFYRYSFKKHRVIALTDVILQEVSTPEVDDVIRLQDDVGRGDGKIGSEHNK